MSVENEKVNEKERPFFSVIIPTFNRANCIEKAINSVLNQTYTNWELLIIDNYSNDQTEKIILSYK